MLLPRLLLLPFLCFCWSSADTGEINVCFHRLPRCCLPWTIWTLNFYNRRCAVLLFTAWKPDPSKTWSSTLMVKRLKNNNDFCNVLITKQSKNNVCNAYTTTTIFVINNNFFVLSIFKCFFCLGVFCFVSKFQGYFCIFFFF